MKWFRQLYRIWLLLCFAIPFLLLLPLFIIIIFYQPGRRFIKQLNNLWARCFFVGGFIPYKVIYEAKPLSKKSYVYCANHTSVLDIIAMGLVVRGPYSFMGKAELGKIPLFGFMFSRLHIPVNRVSKTQSYQALQKALDTVDKGFSILMYPEGTRSKKAPKLQRFKDGAFKIAIEKQVPIVPVTMPYNWKILGNDSLPNWHKGKAIVHKPIETQGLTMDDLAMLKQQTFTVIDNELKKYYEPQLATERRSSNAS
ncbi:lysophospholipid acyltransferase family protein [Microscilla marina]|uniref:1-acyl-sn-glycerol-3-phosphate acyltransferase n=1 Tax=Microscilla marina ATCC 23134 TaxID=313606 RepID=A1ZXZ2_MICM2|nr:lysophospholipid acyltransferase family protein [Microscilla marina]EAY24729.1 1-acyl-sn-glycerol-3-phosphate acyltransferase [Microscilla marina ATCC 23134]